jgi:hypothetical protein
MFLSLFAILLVFSLFRLRGHIVIYHPVRNFLLFFSLHVSGSRF